MTDVLIRAQYIYGREAAFHEKVWTEQAVREAIMADRENRTTVPAPGSVVTYAPIITHVAVKTKRAIFFLPKPLRHHHILQTMNPLDLIEGEEQGFMDSTGRFLTRLEAMKVAKDSGQFNRILDPKLYQGPELFSEDLW